MSNYAPSPSKKPIYQNLATKSLSEVTSNEIQTITDPVKLAAINQDALIVNNIVNEAAMRDGRPIPLSGKIAQYVQNNDSDYQYIQPPAGEVWQVMGISANNSPSVTGSNGYFFYFTDQDGQSLANSVYYSSTSSSSNNVPFEVLDENVTMPIILDNKCFLLAYSNFDNVGTSPTVTWSVAYFRLR